MQRFAAAGIVVFALIAAASCQLSCTSQLRFLPQFQHLFAHCQCSYSQWSEWTPVSSSVVPNSQCASGRALREERRQVVISGSNCNDRSEDRTVCKSNNDVIMRTKHSLHCFVGEPELIDQLILGLGLGSSGQQITPSFNPKQRPSAIIVNQTAPDSNTLTRGKRSNCEAKQICQHVTTPHGKKFAIIP